MNIPIDKDALETILTRNSELEQQNQELQAALSRKRTEERGLRYQVHEFHEKYGYPVRFEVTKLTTEELRFRLRLIAEEFLEVLEAVQSAAFIDINSLKVVDSIPPDLNEIRAGIEHIIERAGSVDLPEFVDALGDLDYVVEGTRLYLGVNGSEVAAEIHRANMAKEAHPNPNGGKALKPEGWTPPDIEGVLKRQGWKP